MSEDPRAWRALFGAGAESDDDPGKAAVLARLRREMFAADAEPVRLGRLTVLGRIGRGGMGVVYAAYDPDLDRKVAVKVLHLRNRRAAERTLREGRALAKIAHPNVVVVHDVEEVEGHLHIVMEHVGGGTLREWLRGDRTWREIVACLVAAGRGLQAAHARGLVHGDFKPENVLLGEGGERPRVADFGLAVAQEDTLASEASSSSSQSQGELTRGGGTVGYASPEQVRGAPIDARSDQFGFSVALYEALFGVRPYSPDAIRRAELGEPSAPSAGAPRVPAAIHRALRRGLASDPAARFATIDPLLDRLDAALRPRARRVSVLVAGLGGLGLGVFFATRDPPPIDCEAEPQAIVGHWETQRGAIAAALRSTQRPAAADVMQRIDQGVAQWTSSWSDAWRSTCTAVRVDPVADAQRRSCLQQTRGDLEALVDALTEVTPHDLPQVPTAIADLRDPSRCLSGSAASWPSPPPEHEVEILALRSRLAEADADLALGRFASAEHRARAVLERGQQIADDTLVAEALHRVASAQESLGDLNDAVGTHTDALWRAYRVGRHSVVALSAIRLTYLRGYLESKLDEGGWWMRLGKEATAAAGDDDPLMALYERTEAMLALRSGSVAEARTHLQAAIDLYERSLGPRHYAVASTMQNLAVVEAMAGDNEAALALLHRAQDVFTESLGAQHPFTASVLKAEGEVLLRLGRSDEAIATLRRSIDQVTAGYGADHPHLADSWSTLGRALLDAGDVEGAADATRRSLAIDEAVHDDPTVEMAIEHNNLALILQRMHDLEGAEAELRRSLAIKEALLGAVDFQLAPTLSNLSDVVEDLGRTSEAGVLTDRALAILDEIEPIEPSDTLAIRVRSAAQLRRRGAPARGRDVVERALALAATQEVTVRARVDALRELARCRLALGDPRSALDAIAEAEPHLHAPDVTETSRARTRLAHAEILVALGRDPVRARRLAREARDVLAAAPDPDPEELARARAIEGSP